MCKFFDEVKKLFDTIYNYNIFRGAPESGLEGRRPKAPFF